MKKATEMDVPIINRIMNHPDVRPWVYEGNEKLDFAGMTEKLVILMNDHAVGIGEHLTGNEYLGIFAAEPEGRGIKMKQLFHDLHDYMFYANDAIRIYGVIKPDNVRSLRFLEKMGATPKRFGDKCIRQLDYIDWSFLSERAKKAGEEANGILEMDESTKRMFGAFLLTVRGGWGGKAYHIFNKYAYMASKKPIKVCNEEFTVFEWSGIKFEIGLDYITEV